MAKRKTTTGFTHLLLFSQIQSGRTSAGQKVAPRSRKSVVIDIESEDEDIVCLEETTPSLPSPSKASSPRPSSPHFFSVQPKNSASLYHNNHSSFVPSSSISSCSISLCLVDILRTLSRHFPFLPFSSKYGSSRHLIALLYVSQYYSDCSVIGEINLFDEIFKNIISHKTSFEEIIEYLKNLDFEAVSMVKSLCSHFFTIEKEKRRDKKSNFKPIKLDGCDDEYLPSDVSDEEFDDDFEDDSDQNLLLLIGDSGLGKSSLITFICRLLDLSFVSFGSECKRDLAWFNSIKDGLDKKSICDVFQRKAKGQNQAGVIVIDDVDSDPDLTVNVLDSLITKSKRPLIFIGNDARKGPLFHICSNFCVRQNIKLTQTSVALKKMFISIVSCTEYLNIEDTLVVKLSTHLFSEKEILNVIQIAGQNARHRRSNSVVLRDFPVNITDEDMSLYDFPFKKLNSVNVGSIMHKNFKYLPTRSFEFWEILDLVVSYQNHVTAKADSQRSVRRSKRGQHFIFDEELIDLTTVNCLPESVFKHSDTIMYDLSNYNSLE
ncbi:hypothetical protein GEMRC1_013337 [Eukaryota sp. GEM-RC1]